LFLFLAQRVKQDIETNIAEVFVGNCLIGRRSADYYFEEDGHFNKNGHQYVGELMATWLIIRLSGSKDLGDK